MLRIFDQFRKEVMLQFPGAQVLQEQEEDGKFAIVLRVNRRPLFFNYPRGYILTVSSHPSSEYIDVRTKKSTHAGYGYERAVYLYN